MILNQICLDLLDPAKKVTRKQRVCFFPHHFVCIVNFFANMDILYELNIFMM